VFLVASEAACSDSPRPSSSRAWRILSPRSMPRTAPLTSASDALPSTARFIATTVAPAAASCISMVPLPSTSRLPAAASSSRLGADLVALRLRRQPGVEGATVEPGGERRHVEPPAMGLDRGAHVARLDAAGNQLADGDLAIEFEPLERRQVDLRFLASRGRRR